MLRYEGQHNVLMSIWQYQLVEGWLGNCLVLKRLGVAIGCVFHVGEIQLSCEVLFQYLLHRIIETKPSKALSIKMDVIQEPEQSSYLWMMRAFVYLKAVSSIRVDWYQT